jgi:ribose transport system substrate-binding protein
MLVMREESLVLQTSEKGRRCMRARSARIRRLGMVGLSVLAIGGVALTDAAASSASSTTAGAAKVKVGVLHAEGVVNARLNKVSGYNTPYQAVKGLSKLKGKTVMYIPLIQAVPAFAITASAMQAALAHVGAKLTICNGAGNPTSVAACITQGIHEKVAGIVTDSIPYVLAANAFSSAEAAHVPVLITDQVPDSSTIKPGLLEYMPGNLDQPQLIADWIIADSKGTANVVVGEENQGPSQIYFITHGLQPEFKKYCPGCKVSIVDIPLDPSGAASAVTAGLNSDPGAQYYYGEFEDELQGATQGIQQAGKASTIKAEYATATIAGLTKMKAHQGIYAEIGDDVNYQGWADADALFREVAGQKSVSENVPERIFDRANVGSIPLTNAAQASGVWYGNPNSFKTAYLKLWGAK